MHYGYAIHPAYYFLHTSPLTQVRTNARTSQRHMRFVLKEYASMAVRVQRLRGQSVKEQGGI